MGDHSFKLRPVQLLKQTCGDNNHRILGVPARGKGIGRRVIDDVTTRLGQSRSNRQSLDNIIQIGVIFLFDRSGPADGQDDFIARVITAECHDNGNNHSQGQSMRAQIGQFSKKPSQCKYQTEEKQYEEKGFSLVTRDLFVHRILMQTLTLRALRK